MPTSDRTPRSCLMTTNRSSTSCGWSRIDDRRIGCWPGPGGGPTGSLRSKTPAGWGGCWPSSWSAAARSWSTCRARLTARTRRLSGHSARKSDEFDARSVAIVGASHTGLRRVQLDDTPAELRVLLDRRWHLVSARHRVICRLHDRFDRTDRRRRQEGPVTDHGSESVAVDPHRQPRRRCPSPGRQGPAGRVALAQPPHQRRPAPSRPGRGHARHHPDRHRRDRHHQRRRHHRDRRRPGPVPDPGTLRVLQRHRPRRRVIGRPRPSPAEPARQPPLNKVIHTVAITQIRTGGPGRDYYERKLAEGKKPLEAIRCLKRQLSDVIYRRLLTDHQRMQTVRDGHLGTSLMAA